MSVTLQAAADITFMIQRKDGVGERKITIPDYYQEYYGVVVTKPRLPCVQVCVCKTGRRNALADSVPVRKESFLTS